MGILIMSPTDDKPKKKPKKMDYSELASIAIDAKNFINETKYKKYNLLINVLFAIISLYITNMNLIYFALCFIAFDFVSGFISEFLFKNNLKKSIKKIRSVNDFKNLLNVYTDEYYWRDEKNDYAYWYKGLKKEYNRLQAIEDKTKEKEEQEKKEKELELSKNVPKDKQAIIEITNSFQESFDELTKEKDVLVFQPCINACNLVKTKMNEGMVFKGPFAKQFVVYMEEFSKNLNSWKSFTKQQRKDYYDDTLLASETFEIWTKKGIEAIEKDVASSLRVSVKTLVDMMEEDISKTQTKIEEKERANYE